MLRPVTVVVVVVVVISLAFRWTAWAGTNKSWGTRDFACARIQAGIKFSFTTRNRQQTVVRSPLPTPHERIDAQSYAT